MIAAAIGIGLLGAACHRPENKQRQVEQTQIQAEKQRSAMEQKLSKEQQQAKQERAKTEENFRREQSDYGNKVKKELGDYKSVTANLKAAETRARAAEKAQDERVLHDATAHQQNLEGDLKMIQKATLAEWDGIKAKVDSDIDALKGILKDAAGRAGTAPPKKEAPTEAPKKEAPAPHK
jgi:hypothetical protein